MEDQGSQPVAEEHRSPVQCEVAALGGSMDMLGGLVGDVEDRLVTVLSEPDKAAEVAPSLTDIEDPRVPLARDIYAIRTLAEGFRERLVVLLNRLEL